MCVLRVCVFVNRSTCALRHEVMSRKFFDVCKSHTPLKHRGMNRGPDQALAESKVCDAARDLRPQSKTVSLHNSSVKC